MQAISYRSFQCVGDLKKFSPPYGSERSTVAHKHVPLVCPMPSEREWLQPSLPLRLSLLVERKRTRKNPCKTVVWGRVGCFKLLTRRWSCRSTPQYRTPNQRKSNVDSGNRSGQIQLDVLLL